MKTNHQNRAKIKSILAGAALVLTGLLAFGQSTPSPFLIPFQGRLTNPQGVPYTNGQFTVIFNLYDQPVGGTLLWSETHQKIGVVNGMVNVFLGSINPALSNVDFSQTRHLGITIDADGNPNTPDPEMVPRQMIIPAFAAKNSENLAGYNWTQIFGVNSPVGPIPGGKLQNNSITAGQIANNSITAAQIANGTITSQQLGASIITSNQIAPGSISAVNLAPGSVGNLQLATNAVSLTNLITRQVGTNVAIGGVGVSLSSGQFSTSSATDVAVANLNVSIATTGTGRPVMLFLAGDSNNSDSGSDAFVGVTASSPYTLFHLSVYRGATRIYGVFHGLNPVANTAEWNSPSAFSFIDFNAPAGTNTYTVYISSDAGMDTVKVNNVRLVAYEL